ncbi:short-subunit dehydrogenase [Stella humosa]|uniref:Short-subunit dehydrogenase n=2 Tax=Stella humosa TaxID=94 RepID=A0A3N1KSD0_9PROT|nr:short-subunit dehydrogenase [Stella humosa]BBK32649.1 short-chain dehydrogenase [Stella humosa]
MPTIVITGASRGIGLELAKAYRQDGATVIAGVRTPEAFPLLGCRPLKLDVGDAGSVAAFAQALKGEPVDILINNAGIIGPKRQSSHDMDFDGFLETLAINTLGPLRVTQALLPNLLLASGARVAVISSRMGSLSYATPDRIAYRASKAAVNKVVQCLATDLAGKGVAVASLHPGWVRTDMGGAGADISPPESARGVKAVVDRLTVATTGRFWNYSGEELPW